MAALHNEVMQRKSTPDALSGHTPDGRLIEGPLRQILGYRLAQATVLTSTVFEREVGAGCDLRPVEFTILSLIAHNPDASASHLARALSMTAPNVKLWLDRLESRGLVQRAPSPQDRRSSHLRATTEGKALAQRAAGMLLDAESQALGTLSVGERTILVELLQKLAQVAAGPR